MSYWLFKSEPSVFGIDDLAAEPKATAHWDGVRNYQARNFMRDRMRLGDQAFFYHSSCAEPAIVGIVEIVREAYPDHTQFDPQSTYFDPKSAPEDPRWFMVDLRLLRRLERPVTLKRLKSEPALGDMPLLQKGMRLSVMPVTAAQWRKILALGNERSGSGS